MIPIAKHFDEIEYLHSKEFSVVVKEIFRRLFNFDKKCIIETCGIEAYLYLLFQKKMLKVITLMIGITISFSMVSTYYNHSIITLTNKNSLLQVILLNNLYLNDFSTILHLISLFIFTYLHLNFLTELKRECQKVYLDRIINMSQTKEINWLKSRTLLISGLPKNERNSKILNKVVKYLKRKLDLYLEKNEIGKVVDIVIIPDFSNIIDYEIEKFELIDFKKVINHCNNNLNFPCFPKIYNSEESLNSEIERLENKIKSNDNSEEILSAQAFVCFDSVLSVETILINCQ